MGISDYVQIGINPDTNNYFEWNVAVTEITESFEILYTDKTGRTMAAGAPLTLDPLGTFYSHQVTFARKRPNGNILDFDTLFEYLSVPRFEGIDVNIVHGQQKIHYKAYASSGQRKVTKIDELHTPHVTWDKMTVKFIPIEAFVVPGQVTNNAE